jgi:membrane protein YdbS with pleckstrin-like domain
MAPDEDAAAAASAQWHAPSPRLTVLRRYEVSGVTVVLLILAVVLALVLNAGGVAIIAAIAVMLVGAVADVVAERRVRAWSYAERAEDLIVKRGVMFRRTSVIPYGRMQYVEVTAGPFERAFGLATVQMHTAAAASDARIPGLPVAEAARLRDQLTSLGESHAMGL